jgi:hypothetical protein
LPAVDAAVVVAARLGCFGTRCCEADAVDDPKSPADDDEDDEEEDEDDEAVPPLPLQLGHEYCSEGFSEHSAASTLPLTIWEGKCNS